MYAFNFADKIAHTYIIHDWDENFPRLYVCSLVLSIPYNKCNSSVDSLTFFVVPATVNKVTLKRKHATWEVKSFH